eukprot:5644537-Lingulodinium_polyedra.AAC.1
MGACGVWSCPSRLSSRALHSSRAARAARRTARSTRCCCSSSTGTWSRCTAASSGASTTWT